MNYEAAVFAGSY